MVSDLDGRRKFKISNFQVEKVEGVFDGLVHVEVFVARQPKKNKMMACMKQI
jgi:hypothetical protein